MKPSIAQNAAVLSPWASLTSRQQEILLDIDPLKTARVKNGWMVRGARAAKGTVDKLQAKGLVTERLIHGRERLALTEAGKLAADRLEQHRRGGKEPVYGAA